MLRRFLVIGHRFIGHWNGVPWGLAVIVVIFCILGAIHSVVVPLFEAPDEIWHFSFVRVLAAQRSLPVQPAEVKDMWLRETGQPPLYYLLAAPTIAFLDTSDFPDFVRFNDAHPAVAARSQSEAPNVFIHTPHEAFPYEGAVLAVHIVRLLSVLWGAGTIVGAYLVAREIVPTRPGLALAAASIVAFNPHFVYISSVVNNDACVACLCTLALWLTARMGRETRFLPQNRVSAFALGLVLGLALLSKVSALALPLLVALALWLMWWRDRDVRALVMRGLTIFGLAALVAAWWYVRNWLLYGDPLAWRVWLVDIGVHHIGLAELLRQFGHVATSFWSPYDRLFPSPVFWALGLLVALATAGWARLIVRRDARAKVNTDGLLLAGTWFVLLFAGLVRYMTTTPSAEGRLLFPGIAAFALLLALGVASVVSQRWLGATLGVAGAGLLALTVASPFCFISPRFALPLVDSIQDISVETPFDDAVFGDVRLLGIDVEPDEAQAGETVSVTLYWEAQATPPADLRAVVRLWTIGGRLVGQRDTTPAGEVYPPDLWRAGDVLRDVYRLQVDGNGPAMCRVEVSVMAGDESLGEASSPAMMKLAAPPISIAPIARPYRFGDRIELLEYEVPDSPPMPGEPLAVTLYWRALAEMDEDYTVFVHLLDGDGTLLGQGDGPPLNGDYPTAHWSPGEVLADTHVVRLEDGLPEGAYLLVGLYRLADGTRLPAYTATGERVPDDAIMLDLGAPTRARFSRSVPF
jgi:4-amino-4-deoxy-L-arabinose transferase-like glycosyltransferase